MGVDDRAENPGGADLEAIVKQTVKTIELARDQIFDIAESCRSEYERMRAELEGARAEAQHAITDVDQLERKDQAARKRLADVSRDFATRSEQEIRDAYETARVFGVELQVARERELHLRKRRDEVERRVRQLEQMLQRAERLVSHVGMAMELLTGRMEGLLDKLNTMQQKSQLGLSVIRAQEEERRRVARDIHDGPAQLLGGVALRLELCQKLSGVDPDRLRTELEQLGELVRQSLKEVRKIIFDLRPMALDDLGLLPALRTYLKRVEQDTDLSMTAVLSGEELRLDSSMEVAVFRFIQEGINNAIAHSQAKSVTVEVGVTDKVVRAIVVDDGVGFDPEEVRGKGYGLLNMRERVDLLDGRFQIDTGPNRGTRIEMEIPVPPGQR